MNIVKLNRLVTDVYAQWFTNAMDEASTSKVATVLVDIVGNRFLVAGGSLTLRPESWQLKTMSPEDRVAVISEFASRLSHKDLTFLRGLGLTGES